MRLAVCLKQVISRVSHLRVDDAGTWIRDADATWELNEPDAYALEEALRLRERHGGEVVAVSAGPARVGQVLREALARGADRAVHVESESIAAAGASVVADLLAAGLREAGADLVLTGLQSDDHGYGQTGVFVAARLGMAHATIVVQVEVGDGRVRVKRELEGGWFQWVTLPLPAVITIQSGINQLRYATLKGIMAARKKEVQVVRAPEMAQPHQRIVSLATPERTRKIRLLEGPAAATAADLVTRLRDERAL
jgi:electron transfer flavoprotein beta subunit